MHTIKTAITNQSMATNIPPKIILIKQRAHSGYPVLTLMLVLVQ